MPPPPPYAAQQQQQQQQPFPALYLYPLNDSFVPKHISLVAGQRVKIGRQTNPKTAPGEKNGFFDSKVLSRQHAEIWEDGNKIYIKDVKSSNGTFINGERLSPEGVESEPYELKSDDIVEFGIDIVGEDNKTIIHHKVAARAVCVFSEQDAQVAARAEQHQQQQHQQQHLLQQQHQQQQQQQQQYAQHPLMGAAQPGPNSTFNFVSSGGPQQRRPGPGVGQGIAGIGGMGGSMRPPGKSGLTFEHILNRLQGELQKSRETGSELHSLTGSMTEIHDVLGGNMPSNVPPYPAALPPVRPTRQSSPSQPQDSHPSSPPHDQQPQPPQHENQHPSPSTVITQLQAQLHDTQSSLADHANKVRALEDVLADQELIRKEVHDLRQLVENRRQEIMFDHQQHDLEPRGGFEDDDDDIQHIRMLDEVDDSSDDDDDDDDDVRSIATIIPHELERVDEEDEEQVAAAERADQVDEVDSYHREDREDRADPIDPEREREDERERQYEQDALRKQEDLNVGRPRTPEPSFGLREDSSKDPSKPININTSTSPRTRSGTLLAPNSNHSPSSPLSLSSPSTNGLPHSPTKTNGVTNDEMMEQVLQLSAQISAMVKLTSSMEAQYAAAQDTIRVLEGKVGELERAVKDSKEVSAPVVEEPAKEEKEDVEDVKQSLTSFFSEWKKSVEGQWSSVKEEWTLERERLKRAREEWEFKSKSIDNGLEKMSSGLEKIGVMVKDVQGQKSELQRVLSAQQVLRVMGNGDVAGGGGRGSGSGLVTPPSPRSQSSDSSGGGGGAGRRRRKRRSASEGRGRKGGGQRAGLSSEGEESLGSDDATLASGVDAVKVTAFATREKNPRGTTQELTNASRAYLLSLVHQQEQVGIDCEIDDAGSVGESLESFASEEEVEEGRKVPGPAKFPSKTRILSVQGKMKPMLPTPASTMGSSFVSDVPEEEEVSSGNIHRNTANFRTAGAVVVLAAFTAAVFWRARSE